MRASTREKGRRIGHAIIRHPEPRLGDLAPGSFVTAFPYEMQRHRHKPSLRDVQATIILPHLLQYGT